MIRLTFSGKTFEELRDQVSAAATSMTGIAPHQLTGGPTKAAEITMTGEMIAAEAAAPKKRGRKPKEETVAAAAITAPTVTTTETTSAPQQAATAVAAPAVATPTSTEPVSISKEAVIEVLKKVSDTRGIAAARALLSEFGVNRVGELEPSKYSQFIDACAGRIA